MVSGRVVPTLGSMRGRRGAHLFIRNVGHLEGVVLKLMPAQLLDGSATQQGKVSFLRDKSEKPLSPAACSHNKSPSGWHNLSECTALSQSHQLCSSKLVVNNEMVIVTRLFTFWGLFSFTTGSTLSILTKSFFGFGPQLAVLRV